MKLIVGLGNPGEKYASTRHNLGFMVADRIRGEIGPTALEWRQEARFKGMLAKTGDVILLKPLTFVNNSGLAVASVVSYFKLQPQDLWVVHDDIDLPLGKLRIRQGGASAGHHGVDSIIKSLKSDKFIRFRLGIGRGKESTGKQMDKNLHHRWVIDFVLSHFRVSEAGELKHLVKKGTEAVMLALSQGLDRAMNRFN